MEQTSESVQQPNANDAYAVHATSSLLDNRTNILKTNDTFAIFDNHGDVAQDGRQGELGLYFNGTRFLAKSVLRISNGVRPLLLSSNLSYESGTLSIDLTNPDIVLNDGPLASGQLHFKRSIFVANGSCHEQLTIRSFVNRPISFDLRFEYAADYADLFEIRGSTRKRRGQTLNSVVYGDTLELGYQGLDGCSRRTKIVVSGTGVHIDALGVTCSLALAPREVAELAIEIQCWVDDSAPADRGMTASRTALNTFQQKKFNNFPIIESDNPSFNDWMARSISDFNLLTTESSGGLFPFAGVPWYSTYFGRDSIIAAWQALWMNPAIARGVLRFLASTQARAESAEHDSEPGKIIHEMRGGEMAALGEVPFGRYYGSIDSTPLFIGLAGAYFDRTADLELIDEIWPELTAALDWLETFGDPDGDGFLEYAPKTKKGLSQQGWKDSADSVFHDDGTIANTPIALCEVQGYAYAAFQAMRKLSRKMGDETRALRCEAKGETLRHKFDEKFWSEKLGSYALALDAQKQPCLVQSSNAGQCLFSGICKPERAVRVAEKMMSDDMFSGWGIRTLSRQEKRYNPMAYHNGSIWPHDNSLIVAGFARYGLKSPTERIFTAFLAASEKLDLHRMPELFCGFDRRSNEAPVLYPVACAPQAWAAGAVFMLLQSVLGLEINAENHLIRLHLPRLPEPLHELRIRRLKVGGSSVDLIVQKSDDDVISVKIENLVGDMRVETGK